MDSGPPVLRADAAVSWQPRTAHPPSSLHPPLHSRRPGLLLSPLHARVVHRTNARGDEPKKYQALYRDLFLKTIFTICVKY